MGTVTAQLLYEIAGPHYPNTDVVARFDTLTVDQEGPDQVRITGCRGLPAPDDVKVCLNLLGGWRNSMTFVLTGLDIEAKADLTVRSLEAVLGGLDEVDSLSSLKTNVTVTEILDAARRSAQTGKSVVLPLTRQD